MVAPSFKQKNVVVAYSPVFARQSAIGTALAAAALTASLPLARDAKPLPSRRVTREEERDCAGKFLTGRRITSRLTNWQLAFDATPALVYGFLAMAMGASSDPVEAVAPFTHEGTHATADQVPATSFIVAAEDSEQPAELYKDMVVNTVEVTGEVRGKVRLTVGFIGSADVDTIANFDVPACATVAPVYANDCLLTIAGTNRTPDLRSFAYNFNNNILSNDDPFPFSDIDVARLERDIEVSTARFALYGTAAHPVYQSARDEGIVPVSLRIGGAASHALITMAGAQLSLQDTGIGYAGEANRSVINLDATPFSIDDNAPDRVTGVLTTGERFLTVPA
ncbi:MAG: phage tail tube protein [Pyrinomonadaceae bacterium MAG19_C2-C3]|nr:phage tail tube protein [Pyrinomonadaceae bacterium MAG19_C2-C3]